MENNRKNRLIRALLILLPLAVVCGAVLVTVLGFAAGQQKRAAPPASYVAPSVVTPVLSAPPSAPPSVSAPPLVSAPPSSAVPSSVAPSQSLPPVPVPPGFTEAPAVSVEGGTASVTFKTDVSSTVNTILVTSGDGVSVGAFYDYFSRGVEYAPAVEQKVALMVDAEGVTETYELPEPGQSYYLLVNAVENESGEWQKEIAVIPLYIVQ